MFDFFYEIRFLKAMMQLALSITFFTGYAQSGLTIQSATPFVIAAGTPVSVDGLVIQPSVTLAVPAPNSLVRNAAITSPSASSSINRAFKLSNTITGFSGAVIIYYLDAELNGIAESNLTLNNHNGTSWSDYSTGVTRDATSNYVITSGLSNLNLSELTLASVLAPLPLLWGPVQAIRSKTTAKVKWNTYDENNTQFFEIERSIDGIQFTSTGLRTQAFNAPGNHHYEVKDGEAPAVKTFYRIKQVDHDGRSTLSPVVFINAIENNTGIEVVVYPNPARDEINVRLATAGLYIRAIRLYNAGGMLLQTTNNVNNTIGRINIGSRPAGPYWLQVESSDGFFINHSFIKQ
jgi:hypothetical protein